MLGYIYKITNLINGKIYIGQHKKNDNSLSELDTTYWASGVKINNAFKKYGYENFTREILCWCDSSEELNNKEIFFIDSYNATDNSIGYNIAAGGNQGGNLVKGYSKEKLIEHCKKISEGNKRAWKNTTIRNKYLESFSKRDKQWKDKISKTLTGRKGKPLSEEVKQKLRQISKGNKYGLGNKSRKGYKNSEEMNKKISESLKGVIHTDEWNKNVSKALAGKPKSESHKAALRKPKPRYYFLKPDGAIIIMDAGNGKRHEGWIQLNKVENNILDQNIK